MKEPMNKIDAFFVTFSIFLAWIIFAIIAPTKWLLFVCWLVGAFSIGVWIGNIYLKLRRMNNESIMDEMEYWHNKFRDTAYAHIENLEDIRASQNRQIHLQQSVIDALMLEYCPEAMTETQKENWADHQVTAVLDPQTEAILDKIKRK